MFQKKPSASEVDGVRWLSASAKVRQLSSIIDLALSCMSCKRSSRVMARPRASGHATQSIWYFLP